MTDASGAAAAKLTVFMKSNYQALRDRKRLAIYLIKLSTRGKYKESGEIFAKSENRFKLMKKPMPRRLSSFS